MNTYIIVWWYNIHKSTPASHLDHSCCPKPRYNLEENCQLNLLPNCRFHFDVTNVQKIEAALVRFTSFPFRMSRAHSSQNVSAGENIFRDTRQYPLSVRTLKNYTVKNKTPPLVTCTFRLTTSTSWVANKISRVKCSGKKQPVLITAQSDVNITFHLDRNQETPSDFCLLFGTENRARRRHTLNLFAQQCRTHSHNTVPEEFGRQFIADGGQKIKSCILFLRFQWWTQLSSDRNVRN